MHAKHVDRADLHPNTQISFTLDHFAIFICLPGPNPRLFRITDPLRSWIEPFILLDSDDEWGLVIGTASKLKV